MTGGKSIFHSFAKCQLPFDDVLLAKMCKNSEIFIFLALVSCVVANYNGPFILWGREELKKFDVPALQGLDDTILRNIYSESPAIILFVRNGSTRFNEENFPTFKDLLQKNKYVYLTQHWLPSDPIDYNVNAEVSETKPIVYHIFIDFFPKLTTLTLRVSRDTHPKIAPIYRRMCFSRICFGCDIGR